MKRAFKRKKVSVCPPQNNSTREEPFIPPRHTSKEIRVGEVVKSTDQDELVEADKDMDEVLPNEQQQSSANDEALVQEREVADGGDKSLEDHEKIADAVEGSQEVHKKVPEGVVLDDVVAPKVRPVCRVAPLVQFIVLDE